MTDVVEPEEVDLPTATPSRFALWAMGRVCAVTMSLGNARYVIGDVVGWTCYMTMPGHRTRAVRNHSRLNPDLTRRQARHLARRSFCEYARMAVDFIWALQLPISTVKGVCTIDGIDEIIKEKKAGKGGILALTHFGTWDMAANAAAAHGIPLTTVMAPVGGVTDVVMWARTSNGLEVFEPRKAARGLFRAIRRGRWVALLCDIPSAGHTVDVDYCGGQVRFSSAPAWLAKVTGSSLYACSSQRSHDGFHMIVHPRIEVTASDSDDDIMQRVAAAAEQEVRGTPHQWYPFHDVYVQS